MNLAIFANLFGNPFAPLLPFFIGAFVLFVVGAIIAIIVQQARANWRIDMIRNEPEVYKQYREWEEQEEAKLKEAMDKTKDTAGKVAGAAGTAALWAAKTFLKK